MCSLIVSFLANLRCDSEFVGRLDIKLPCDRQTLHLLKSTDARTRSQSEQAVDLPAVVSLVLQNLLRRICIVRLPALGVRC